MAIVGYGFITPAIESASGLPGHVQLNSQHCDSGDRDWEWYFENFAGGARWLRLGDCKEDGENDEVEVDPNDDIEGDLG